MHAYRSVVHKQEGTVYIKVCSIYKYREKKQQQLNVYYMIRKMND